MGIGQELRGVAVFLILLSLSPILADSRENKECHLPPGWAGVWFQQGVRPYSTIDRRTISNKGECVTRHKDRVVVRRGECYKCIVFHKRHLNVLQYKESAACLPEASLSSLCSAIPGDAPLYTLFRVQTQPIRCPLQGPARFSYDFGRGSCHSPLSNMESCTLDSRISLQYQACPNVRGSEMKNTQFECLASWREGRYSFLVGRMEDAHTNMDEDRYRCIMWERGKEKGAPAIFLSISGDASCNGLFSTREGRALVLYEESSGSPGCTFPPWLTAGKSWTSLGGDLLLDLDQVDGGMKLTRRKAINEGGRYYHESETSQVRCQEERRSSNNEKEILLVTHVTTGCTTGYMCTLVRKRAEAVIELTTGKTSLTPEYACDADHFSHTSPTILVGTSSSSSCPLVGTYTVSMKHSDFSLAVKPDILPEGETSKGPRCAAAYLLEMGCQGRKMLFTACHGGLRETSQHECHTEWKEGAEQYFVTRNTNREEEFSCYSYHQRGLDLLEVEMRGQQCDPTTPSPGRHTFSFNMTEREDCPVARGHHLTSRFLLLLLMLFLVSR